MADLEEIVRNSTDDEDALFNLKEVGASPVQAIKALTTVRGTSLREAKEKLLASPAWSSEADHAEKLHEQLDDLLD